MSCCRHLVGIRSVDIGIVTLGATGTAPSFSVSSSLPFGNPSLWVRQGSWHQRVIALRVSDLLLFLGDRDENLASTLGALDLVLFSLLLTSSSLR